jgi:hypothetical protein
MNNLHKIKVDNLYKIKVKKSTRFEIKIVLQEMRRY